MSIIQSNRYQWLSVDVLLDSDWIESILYNCTNVWFDAQIWSK